MAVKLRGVLIFVLGAGMIGVAIAMVFGLAAEPGAGSALLRLVAAGALIAAAGLVLPYVARNSVASHPETSHNPKDPKDPNGYGTLCDLVGIYKRGAEYQDLPSRLTGYGQAGQGGRWVFTRTNRRAGADG